MSNHHSPPIDPATRDEIVRRIQKRVLDDSSEEIAGLWRKHDIEPITQAFCAFGRNGTSYNRKPRAACVIGILAYDDVISHVTPEPTREIMLAVCERYFDGDKEFIAFSDGFDDEDFWHDEAYREIYDKGAQVRRLAFGE